jgi:hypothetical protein
MPLEKHDPEKAGLEAALAALAPMPGRINRDALLFRAGQASVPRRGWAWPAATAVLGLVAAILAAVIVLRPAPAPVERVIVVPAKEPALPAPPVDVPSPPPPVVEPTPASPGGATTAQSPMNYLQLQQQVLRWGLDGVPSLPETPPPPVLPVTRDQWPGAPAEPGPLSRFLYLGSFFQ